MKTAGWRPVWKTQAAADNSKEQSQVKSIVARRVLVGEAEPLISMMVQDWFDELGYECVGPAQTVSEALELLTRTRQMQPFWMG